MLSSFAMCAVLIRKPAHPHILPKPPAFAAGRRSLTQSMQHWDALRGADAVVQRCDRAVVWRVLAQKPGLRYNDERIATRIDRLNHCFFERDLNTEVAAPPPTHRPRQEVRLDPTTHTLL